MEFIDMFKTNDRVRYMGTAPRYRGLDGTVQDVSPQRGLFRVLMDNGGRISVTAAKLALVAVQAPVADLGVDRRNPVEVFDRSNRKRLLGTLADRPVAALRGPRVSMAVLGRPGPSWFDEEPDGPMNASVDRVDFDLDFRLSADGWSNTAVLLTDAPLKLLLSVPSFRLPGECDVAADRRRFYA